MWEISKKRPEKDFKEEIIALFEHQREINFQNYLNYFEN